MSILHKIHTILAEAKVSNHPKIEHDGELVHTTNSEGKRIHPTDEGVKSFHDWFGKSKVTDKHGRPQVMYHGTGSDIPEFSLSHVGYGNDSHGPGFYFTDRADTASGYASAHAHDDTKSPNVIKAYLNVTKPIKESDNKPFTHAQVKNLITSAPDHKESLNNFGDVDYEGYHKVLHGAVNGYADLPKKHAISNLQNDFYYGHSGALLANLKKHTGHDGVHVDFGMDGSVITAFHPSQIKSAIGNNGSFSKTSDKITEELLSEEVSELASTLKLKYPELKNLNLYDRGNDLRLDTIIVKKEHRNSGIGSKVISDIKDYADKNGKRVTLTAGVKDPHVGTTSQSRLDKFYKSHGFVANKGRAKDFSISATHYYQGKKLDEGFVKNAIGAALVAGAALGIHSGLQQHVDPITPQLQIVKKPTTMNADEATNHIVKTYHVNPDLAKTITTAAFKHGDANGFPTPHHLLGLMAAESSFNPNEVSRLKKDPAIGITQIRPKTSGIHPNELKTVDDQVRHASHILKDFHKRANGDVNMALSSYNNGFRAVYNNRPTVNKRYAPKVLKATEQFHLPSEE